MPEEVMDYGLFDMVGEFLRWHNIYLVNSQKEREREKKKNIYLVKISGFGLTFLSLDSEYMCIY